MQLLMQCLISSVSDCAKGVDSLSFLLLWLTILGCFMFLLLIFVMSFPVEVNQRDNSLAGSLFC